MAFYTQQPIKEPIQVVMGEEESGEIEREVLIPDEQILSFGYTFDGRNVRVESWDSINFSGFQFTFQKWEEQPLPKDEILNRIKTLEEYQTIPEAYKLDPKIFISEDIDNNAVYVVVYLTFVK